MGITPGEFPNKRPRPSPRNSLPSWRWAGLGSGWESWYPNLRQLHQGTVLPEDRRSPSDESRGTESTMCDWFEETREQADLVAGLVARNGGTRVAEGNCG
jgi:hypothetical protein